MPNTLTYRISAGLLFAIMLSALVPFSVAADPSNLKVRPANFDQQSSIVVASALRASQTTVSAGQQFTLSFILRNMSSAPVTLSHVLAAGRDSTVCPNAYCQEGKVDFPVETSRVIAPGDTYTYEQAASIGDVGAYFFQIAYAINNDWTIIDPKLDITVERGLEIEEALMIAPETIVAGSAITARFTLKNYGSQPVTLNRLFVGGRDLSLCSNLPCQQGKSDIHIQDNVAIAAGESKSFEETSSVAEAGTYFFQITYEQNGVWNNVGDKPEVTVTRGLEIVSPLVLMPTEILSGEAATASFTLKNFSTEPIQIRRMLAAGRPKTSDCQEIYDCFEKRVDFDLEEGPTDDLEEGQKPMGFTMMPGEEKSYQKSRIMGEPGMFFFQVSFQIGDESVGQDENWFNIGERKDLAVTPGLILTQPLTFTSNPVDKNRQLRAEFSLENQGDRTFKYLKVGIALRGPACDPVEDGFGCQQDVFDYEFFENVVIEPGGRFRFVEGRSFPKAGRYFARISVQAEDESWAFIGEEIQFSTGEGGANFPDVARAQELTLGVHFHPQWNEEDFERLELAAEAGFETVRIGPSWRKLEPYNKGEYDPDAIAELDAVVNKAIDLGMDVYLMFAQTPCWASSDPAKICNRQGPENHGEYNDWYPATNYDDYADAFVKLVELFGDRVDTFEVWNEPNRKQFWPPYANATEYTEMLKAVHREVSSRYPDVTILGGSLAGADVVFLEDMYQAGAKGTFDKLAMHPYANADAPDECSNSRWAFLCGIQEIRHAMEQEEDSVPIWFTEFGWSTYDGDRGVSEAKQLENFQQSLQLLDDLGYVEVATWYNLVEGGAGEDAGDEVNSFGLFRESYEPKPAADWLISVNDEGGPVDDDNPPLLVVHGIQALSFSGFECKTGAVRYSSSAERTLDDLPGWFADSHQVWLAHYTSSALYTASFESNANCLRDQINHVYNEVNQDGGERKLTIIAHSMGGLVTRACLAYRDCRDKVETVFTLGSPHAGINWGFVSKIILKLAENALKANGIPVPLEDGVCVWQQGYCEMSTEEMNIFNLIPGHRNQSDIDYTFIGGEATVGVVAQILRITDGKNDGAVGRNSAMGWTSVAGFFPTEIGGWTSPSSPDRYWTDEVHFSGWGGGYGYQQERNGKNSHAYKCIAYGMGLEGFDSRPSECTVASNNVVTSANVESGLNQSTESFDGVLNVGEIITHTLQIDTSGTSLLTLAWSDGAVRFELVSPSGQRLKPEDTLGLATYSFDAANEALPALAAYEFTNTEIGQWQLIVDAQSLTVPATGYVGFAAMESGRQLTISQNKQQYQAGETATFTATLTMDGVGIDSAVVTSTLNLPTGINELLQYENIDSGIYRATYIVPNHGGRVAMTTLAAGENGGTLFTREADDIWSIILPSASFTGNNADLPVDDSGDGIYNSLIVTVEINVTTPSTFTVSAALTRDEMIIDTTSDSVSASKPGVYSATLRFDGSDVATIGSSGAFTVSTATLIDVGLGDLVVAAVDELHVTGVYDTLEFKPLDDTQPETKRVYLPLID